MELFSIHNISKQYAGHVALDDVSISIPKGSIFGLLGPNGAGKTSLIRIINQITAPDSGHILFDGEPLKPSHVEQIGYMPEERGLYKKMEVGEQALYLAQLKGLSEKEAKIKLKYWFEKLGIQGWWKKKVEELSKGMAQKIQFIVTVLHEPKLLIFDEPFSGFDPVNANLIKDEILELSQKGSTIIFSTHRMESVEQMCDHIALIHKSKKILDGPIDEIRNQFRNHTFDIQYKADKMWKPQLSDDYSIIEQDPNKGTLTIRPKEHISTNELLQKLISQCEIQAFKERIPNMNDIFIQSVKS